MIFCCEKFQITHCFCHILKLRLNTELRWKTVNLIWLFCNKYLLILFLFWCIIIILLSLTGVIRTCPKNSIFGIFWIVILERRQPSGVFRTKIYPKIQDFQVVEFLARRFLIERGKNAMNPDGFMSILTKFKWKSSAIKSGSDDFCQARINT